MAAMEQPFGENEIRYFLAEILKKSSIAPLDLMNFIQERGIQPSWYEIALPNGRSVSSCIAVWQNLHANFQARFTAPVQPMVTFQQPSSQDASKPKRKRPASGENVSTEVDRILQPQLPFNFPPVNPPSGPATDQGITTSVLGGPPKKKRGRPSKLEYEAKVAEAAARGEEYHPTPRRKKTPRPSLQDAPDLGMVTPSMAEVGTVGEGSAGKNKSRKPKAALGELGEASGLASEPTARNFALEATAHAADQMQIDEKNTFKSTIPETQASEVEVRESLLANIRDNSVRTAPDTVQSTMTLQHDSNPHDNFTPYQGPTRDPASTGEQQFL